MEPIKNEADSTDELDLIQCALLALSSVGAVLAAMVVGLFAMVVVTAPFWLPVVIVMMFWRIFFG